MTQDAKHKALHAKLRKAGKQDYELEHEGGFKKGAKKPFKKK